MNDKIKSAFDDIHVDNGLKNRTMEYISKKTNRFGKTAFSYRRIIPAAACLLIILSGVFAYGTYFTPVSVISIDINPSFEMGINRFDKVVSLESFNDDGEKLTEKIDVRFIDYTEAIDRIINDENVESYMSDGEIMSIAVFSADNDRNERILSDIERCAEGHNNTYCYSANRAEVAAAHSVGLSYGKYRAFLQLKEIYPDITEEEIRDMTMREIHDMTNNCDSGYEQKETGHKYQHGKGHGNH